MTSDAELAVLKELAAGQVCLELGSAYGRSALAMAETAEEVHCVDHGRGDLHFGLGDHLDGLLKAVRDVPNIVVHVGNFAQVCPVLKPRHFGLVFLDGYHTFDAVTRDIQLSRKLCTIPDGWMVFHDYTIEDTDFGVGPAVDQYFRSKPDRIVESLALVRNTHRFLNEMRKAAAGAV